MLRKLALVGLLVFGTASAQASWDFFGGDNDGFFPWGERMPFPWQEMQGQWVAENDYYTTLFSFSVTNVEDTDEKILNVVQLNPAKSGKIVSRGVGYEHDNIVRAMMRAENKAIYRVYVHVYTKKVKGAYEGPLSAKGPIVKVLSISPVCPSSTAEIMHFVLNRVSSKPIKIRPSKRKLIEFEREVATSCSTK